jgi:hypothetical protein
MLKRGDRAFDDLIAEIKAVISSRFVENPNPFCSPSYTVATCNEPSFAFASLNRQDRLALLGDMVSWREYGARGITEAQRIVLAANVLDGKPAEQWLEGVLDQNAQQKAFWSLLNDSVMERRAESPETPTISESHERGGREM